MLFESLNFEYLLARCAKRGAGKGDTSIRKNQISLGPEFLNRLVEQNSQGYQMCCLHYCKFHIDRIRLRIVQ